MKLLLVEDSQDDADFVGASLRRQQANDVTLVHVKTLASAVTAMRAGGFDIVLLDLQLPDGRGLECVEAIQTADDHIPILVLSGQDDEDFAVSILNRGVQDYIVKWEGQGRTILRSIRYAIERKRAEMRLNYLAQFDPLTALGNRQYFHDQLERATARARREGRKVVLFFLDLDQFKVVNDTLGHEAGDRLLKEIARRLKENVRGGDVIARLGGDEFALLMETISGPLEASVIAQQILDVVGEPFELDGHRMNVTASIGVTLYPHDDHDTQRLVKNADIAMYQAKDTGRNNFKFFTERMHTELIEYHELARDLSEALKNESFYLAFQPKVDLVTRRLQGLEALLRWDCPKRGPVSPAKFIPVAEGTGYIVPIGYWVLQQVCKTIRKWRAEGLPVVPVSVNVSARQFSQPNFHSLVAGALAECGIAPGEIELEMTEGLLMDDSAGALRELQHLKKLGVRISVDDFGTGHSCLNYLRRFPIDVLKIDRSFVQEVGTSEDSEIIIDAILSLARSLRLETVAEGVETNAQLDFLLDRGCRVAQGYLFGAPMSEQDVRPFLEDLRSDPDLTATVAMPSLLAGNGS